MITYTIIDSKTGQQWSRMTFTVRATAQRLADKLDSKYGAVRYIVRPNFSN